MVSIANVDVGRITTTKCHVDVVVNVRKLRDVERNLAAADLIDDDLPSSRDFESVDLREVCAGINGDRLADKGHVAADNEFRTFGNGHGCFRRIKRRRWDCLPAQNGGLYR